MQETKHPSNVTTDAPTPTYYDLHKEECKANARKYYRKRKASIKLKAKARYKMQFGKTNISQQKKYHSDALFAERKRQYNRERMKRLRALKTAKNANVSNE